MDIEKNKNNQKNSSNNFVQETISFTDLILTLADNFKTIILIPIITCIITIVYVTFFAEHEFISSSKIMSSSGTGFSQMSGFAAQFGLNISQNDSEPKWAYSEIIKSRTLARAALKHRFDTVEFGKGKTLLEILTSGNNAQEIGYEKLERIGVQKLLKMIQVIEDQKNSILNLKIRSKEPKLSADINEAIIQELDKHQKKYNKAKTGNTKKFIEERIATTKKDLINAEESLKVFRDRNRRMENSPTLLLEQQRLGREVTVLTSVYTTLKQQYETTKIEEVKESEYVIVLDPPEVPLFRSKPNKKLMVVLAGFLGVGLGILIVLLKRNIYNTDSIEKDKIRLARSMIKKNIHELVSLKIK